MLLRIALLVLFVAACANAQQPFIFYRGVVNAASFMPPGAPNGAIARGSTFSIFGRNLGPASSPPLSFPLQTTLAGVSITVFSGATSVNAIPLVVTPGQINAIMPSNAPLGAVSLRVQFNAGRSNPAPIRVVDSAFGIYSATGTGIGPGILQNFITADQQPVNSLQQSARPGQVLTLWGTGLGPVTFPDNVAPTAGNLPVQTEVFIGGRSARVLYNGRTPCCAGTDQIVIEVPADAPLGCWVPVYVRTAGTNVSNFVTIAITEDGSPCSEPANPVAETLIGGGRIAAALAARLTVRHDVGNLRGHEAITDFAGAYFAEETQSPFNFNPVASLPPPGTCTAYTTAGQVPVAYGRLPGMTPPTLRGLDGGAAGFTGSAGTHPVRVTPVPGVLFAYLGGGVSGVTPPGNLVLSPGSYMFASQGGRDVSPFSANLDVPQPLVWTGRDALAVVERSRGFTVTWSGASPSDRVLVVGGNIDLPVNSTSVFVCSSAAGQNSLTVPPAVMANVAATRARLTQSRGVVYLARLPLGNPARFSASGIDAGFLMHLFVSGKSVTFR
jgi:uncharacterized protein (TIGR03437 family)